MWKFKSGPTPVATLTWRQPFDVKFLTSRQRQRHVTEFFWRRFFCDVTRDARVIFKIFRNSDFQKCSFWTISKGVPFAKVTKMRILDHFQRGTPFGKVTKMRILDSWKSNKKSILDITKINILDIRARVNFGVTSAVADVTRFWSRQLTRAWRHSFDVKLFKSRQRQRHVKQNSRGRILLDASLTQHTFPLFSIVSKRGQNVVMFSDGKWNLQK